MKINFEDIPETTELFIDYLYNFDRVRSFYKWSPYDEDKYEEHLSILSSRSYHRQLLADVLKEQNRRYNNSEMTISSIDRILKDDTSVVFTGQQVGFLGGPMCTIYKAMTAINLARYLTMTTRHTFLPLFWIEGEDHDFEEIRNVYLVDKQNKLARLRYEPVKPFDGQCVGSMILDETVSDMIDKYREMTHPTDFRDEVIEALENCYSPGKNLTEAFGC